MSTEAWRPGRCATRHTPRRRGGRPSRRRPTTRSLRPSACSVSSRMASNGRRGSAPKHDPVVKPASVPPSASNGYPILCLRHLQDKFGIDQLDAQQCQEFLKKWHKRAKLTWNELNQHGKYGLGSEKLPKS